jgi:hypothetical protein
MTSLGFLFDTASENRAKACAVVSPLRPALIMGKPRARDSMVG